MADELVLAQSGSLERFFTEYSQLMEAGLGAIEKRQKLETLVEEHATARAEEVFEGFASTLEASITTLDSYFLQAGKDIGKKVYVNLGSKELSLKEPENIFFYIEISYDPSYKKNPNEFSSREVKDPDNGTFQIKFQGIHEFRQPFILYPKMLGMAKNSSVFLIETRPELERKAKDWFKLKPTGKRITEIYKGKEVMIYKYSTSVSRIKTDDLVEGLKNTYKYHLKLDLLDKGKIEVRNKAYKCELFVDTVKRLPEIIARHYEVQELHDKKALETLTKC